MTFRSNRSAKKRQDRTFGPTPRSSRYWKARGEPSGGRSNSRWTGRPAMGMRRCTVPPGSLLREFTLSTRSRSAP